MSEADTKIHDELVSVCKAISRFRSGPTKASASEWIGQILEIANDARIVLAKVHP